MRRVLKSVAWGFSRWMLSVCVFLNDVSFLNETSGIVYSPLKLHLNCNFDLQQFGVH